MALVAFDRDPVAMFLPDLLEDVGTGRGILYGDGREMTAWGVLSSRLAGGRDVIPDSQYRALTAAAERLRKAGDVPTYVSEPVLDMGCGEGLLTARRYADSGLEVPVKARDGLLDGKLRAVGEYSFSPDTWLRYAAGALASCHGYEADGELLLLARCNVLLDWYEHYLDRWKSPPGGRHVAAACRTIAINFRQLPGIPYGTEWKERFALCVGRFPSGRYWDALDLATALSARWAALIPAQPLFDAGPAPETWRKSMLEDPHMSVEAYFPSEDSVPAKSLAVLSRDAGALPGAIGTFLPNPTLRDILSKITGPGFRGLDGLVHGPGTYRLGEDAAARYPLIRDRFVTDGMLSGMADLFIKAPPEDDADGWMAMAGRGGSRRSVRYVPRDALDPEPSLDFYKVLVPAKAGKGAFGEPLGTPAVAPPGTGHTDAYFSVGGFRTEDEASACAAYLKSKLARTLLGVARTDERCGDPRVWRYVPLQDFTSRSDIRWDGDVDRQLYGKYSLSRSEVRFVESHVRKMA